MTSNRIVALLGATALGIAGMWGVAAAVIAGGGLVSLPAGFGTSALLGGLHLLLAVALTIGCARGDRVARLTNTTVGVILLAAGLFGLFAVGTDANVVGISGATNVLHFGASAMRLAAGLGAAPADPARPTPIRG